MQSRHDALGVARAEKRRLRSASKGMREGERRDYVDRVTRRAFSMQVYRGWSLARLRGASEALYAWTVEP